MAKKKKKRKEKKETTKQSGIQSVSRNKRALFNYEITDKKEAGVVLTGAEVKSIRRGNVNIRESYAKFMKSELFLINAHISPYQPQHKSVEKYVPTRPRKLLLHKKELSLLHGKVQEKGLALLPLEIVIKNNKVKVLLGLGKGKKKYDKREVIKKRDLERNVKRELDE